MLEEHVGAAERKMIACTRDLTIVWTVITPYNKKEINDAMLECKQEWDLIMSSGLAEHLLVAPQT